MVAAIFFFYLKIELLISINNWLYEKVNNYYNFLRVFFQCIRCSRMSCDLLRNARELCLVCWSFTFCYMYSHQYTLWKNPRGKVTNLLTNHGVQGWRMKGVWIKCFDVFYDFKSTHNEETHPAGAIRIILHWNQK